MKRIKNPEKELKDKFKQKNLKVYLVLNKSTKMNWNNLWLIVFENKVLKK